MCSHYPSPSRSEELPPPTYPTNPLTRLQLMLLLLSWSPRCRSPVVSLLHAARPRVFSTLEQALNVVYRKLLEVDADNVFHVTEAQATAVTMAIKGYSVFLHLPTGAGKSLAFQAPALLAPREQTTLVVSPLIALMHVRTSKPCSWEEKRQ